MADESVVIEERFEINDDEASGGIDRIAGAAKRLVGSLSGLGTRILQVAGAAGLIGAAFSFPGLIRGANEFMGSVRTISEVTGLSARHASGLMQAFQGVGIEGSEAERILLSMSRAATRMEESVGKAGRGGGNILKQLGVDLTKGPGATLEQLAGLAQKGKLGIGELMQAMSIRGGQAADLMRLLKQGPEAIKAAMAGGVLGAGDLANFEKAQNLSRQVGASFTAAIAKLESGLLPLVIQAMGYVKAHLDGWMSTAKSVFAFISEHIHAIGVSVEAIGAVLVGAKALTTVTGAVSGIAGFARMIGGAGEAKAAAGAVSALAGGARAAAGAVGSFGKQALDGTSAMEGAMDAVGSFAAALGPVILGLGVAATAFYLIPKALDALKGDPTKQRMMSGISMPIAGSYVPTTDELGFPTLMTQGHTAGGQSMGGVSSTLAAQTAQFDVNPVTGALTVPDFNQSDEDKAPEEPEEPPPINVHVALDLNFAEGFDPERIAVSSTEALASLGDRPVQSTFSPTFSVK